MRMMANESEQSFGPRSAGVNVSLNVLQQEPSFDQGASASPPPRRQPVRTTKHVDNGAGTSHVPAMLLGSSMFAGGVHAYISRQPSTRMFVLGMGLGCTYALAGFIITVSDRAEGYRIAAGSAAAGAVACAAKSVEAGLGKAVLKRRVSLVAVIVPAVRVGAYVGLAVLNLWGAQYYARQLYNMPSPQQSSPRAS